MNNAVSRTSPDVDVVVVGAGMAGLYLLHRLRGLGMSAVAVDAADDVGGTWYWNRYPGARCDIQSLDYQFKFDPELMKDWQWSEKYATQPEILRYLQHVAERYDLRRDIRFETRVTGAKWNEDEGLWHVRTAPASGNGEAGEITGRYYVMATGCLSVPKDPDIPGTERFRGEVYVTGRWPHEKVDFTGKRVAVIGTGSSGIQSIPLIAQEASELVVFQRTPNYSMPAGNGPIPEDKRTAVESDPAGYHEAARWTGVGVVVEEPTERVFDVDEAERQRRFEKAWQMGDLLAPTQQFTDLQIDAEANEQFAEFVRGKIRAIVDDPETAELLCPKGYPFFTKRPCLDTNYFQTFNQDHVRLVDLHSQPIRSITESGIVFGDGDAQEQQDFDAIVYATGFDAMTGALVSVDIEGRDGMTLKEKWCAGPHTYLGLTTAGFPNLFMVTGPGSPSVLSNMVVSIEQHVDWIADCLKDQREQGFTRIEATETAEAGWDTHVMDCAKITLFEQTASWYMGANVPGKPRVFLPYVGGVGTYRETCDRIVEDGYLGFHRSGPAGEQCHDGVVNRLQPDVAGLLKMMAEAQLPSFDSLSAQDARALSAQLAQGNPPGPAVGEVRDGTYPGAEGELPYRLYRPESAGPHPIVAYFHGGGWVLGSHESDDAFCRDLCRRADAVVISLDYRHAPEARFPAAPEDAWAALKWVAANAAALGGDPSRLIVAGWSAGANLAAGVCQRARDENGPAIAGQLLVTPVVDCDFSRPSYMENGEGYVLTRGLMEWFWNHYAEPGERSQPAASPLRAGTLANLPPAAIFTSEFDPLRDEGAAYAEALADAGVPVRHLPCRGHTHTSLTAVGVILSGARVREQMAEALRGFALQAAAA
jgi:cation diffusion facilitator CzcD-associated flavoprotein CzcO/acetyl esterase/lipase